MKAAASLTGSLLARKGAAYPASYSAPSPAPTGSSVASAGNRAYNDPRVIASAPPVSQTDDTPQMQDGRFVEDFKPASHPAPAPSNPCAPSDSMEASGAELPQAMDKMGRVRLSVRLDPDRYLRVKMASARTRWSAQDIVIAALDRYLDGTASKSTTRSQPGEGRDDEDLN